MSTAELAGQTAEPAVAAVAVRDLQVVIEATGTPVISDVSFGIARGEILGVVGESGSGKTTVGLALGLARGAGGAGGRCRGPAPAPPRGAGRAPGSSPGDCPRSPGTVAATV